MKLQGLLGIAVILFLIGIGVFLTGRYIGKKNHSKNEKP